jgi:hypothetical protein
MKDLLVNKNKHSNMWNKTLHTNSFYAASQEGDIYQIDEYTEYWFANSPFGDGVAEGGVSHYRTDDDVPVRKINNHTYEILLDKGKKVVVKKIHSIRHH